MLDRRSIGVITLSVALCLSTDCAQAFDDAKLCVPKIRFCNIGDEVRQGQAGM